MTGSPRARVPRPESPRRRTSGRLASCVRWGVVLFLSVLLASCAPSRFSDSPEPVDEEDEANLMTVDELTETLEEEEQRVEEKAREQPAADEPETPDAEDDLGGTDDAPPGEPALLEVVDGEDQEAPLELWLEEPLSVRVLDGQGTPRSGQTVRFEVVAAPGQGVSFVQERVPEVEDPVTERVIETDEEGEASTRFVVGDAEGVYEIRAVVLTDEGEPAERGGDLQVDFAPVAVDIELYRGIHYTVRDLIRGGRDDDPLVSAQFFEASLSDVTQHFTEEIGFTIDVNPHVTDEDWVPNDSRYPEGPWYRNLESALDAMGRNLEVTTRFQMGQPRNLQVTTTALVREQKDPMVVRLDHLEADDVVGMAREMAERILEGVEAPASLIQTVPGQERHNNILLVYMSEEEFEPIEEMIRDLDHKRPTVMVSAKMAMINRSELEEKGFRYQIIPSEIQGVDPQVQVDPIQGMGAGTLDEDGDTGDPGQPGQPGDPGRFTVGPGQGESVIDVFIQMALTDHLTVSTFVDIMTGTGMASTEAVPSIVTTSDQEASLSVSDFFILPNQQPMVAAGGMLGGFQTPQQGQGQFGGGTQGRFPGQQQPGFQQPGQQQPGFQQPGQQQPGFGGPAGQMPIPGGTVGGYTGFEAGTNLSVTPYVLPNGRVRMNLDIQRDGATLAPDGQSMSGSGQSLQTEVTVRNDESVVLGGLTVTERSTRRQGVPVLKDLPLIGRFFRHEEEARLFQDLVVIITPHIIFDPEDEDYFDDAFWEQYVEEAAEEGEGPEEVEGGGEPPGTLQDPRGGGR